MAKDRREKQAYRDSRDKNNQDWVMGIANAVMALSWAITGLCSNLLNWTGTQGLIFIGGLCLIIGSIILQLTKIKQGV